MADQEGGALSKKPLEGLRVLLVEEEVLVAMDVEEICREHGAKDVRTLSSVVAMKGMIDEEDGFSQVDIAILGAKVGNMRTTGLARRLEERNIPFIFATGYAQSDPFFAQFPGVRVITKPYSTSELVRALASAVCPSPSGDEN